jgi:ATP-dependent Clp protease ATP-binding subunit ClpC
MTTNAGRRGDQERIGLRLPETGRRRQLREHEERVMITSNGVPTGVPQPLGRRTIIFRHLTTRSEGGHRLELSKVRERLQERGFRLEMTDDAKEFLIKKGCNLDYGARPLRRAIDRGSQYDCGRCR